MKIAIIADVHFGIRNDNPLFHDVHTRFFFDHFFPYLRANNIKTLVSLGDLFDRRKYINFKSLYSSLYEQIVVIALPSSLLRILLCREGSL